MTVACEPTGHRWRVLGQLAADRSMPFVCVQPVVTSWSRRTERVQLLMEDWQLTKTRLAETESRMTAVVDELGLTALVTSITGLPAVGAAAILAKTCDPRRFATGRGLVKHAGPALSPAGPS